MASQECIDRQHACLPPHSLLLRLLQMIPTAWQASDCCYMHASGEYSPAFIGQRFDHQHASLLNSVPLMLRTCTFCSLNAYWESLQGCYTLQICRNCSANTALALSENVYSSHFLWSFLGVVQGQAQQSPWKQHCCKLNKQKINGYQVAKFT